jgi:SAM-dependent methyltransferase
MRATDSSLAAQYASLIQKALPMLQWKGLKILDFGAGEGDTAVFFSTVGANVTAVEPYGFELCKAKGVRTFRNLQELPAGTKFDGVLMIEVLEHLQNPVQTLREVKGHLKDGGWLFLTTPHNNSMRARLLRERWSECLKKGHLCLFSREGLVLSLERSGFDRVSPCGGFVRFSENQIRLAAQYCLQVLGLDGQLRFIAMQRGDS